MKDIINNKDKTYSPLALYYLIDNDIDPKKIHSADLDTTYISPVVDLKESSKYARDTIWSIRKGDEFKKIARSVYHKHGSRKRS